MSYWKQKVISHFIDGTVPKLRDFDELEVKTRSAGRMIVVGINRGGHGKGIRNGDVELLLADPADEKRRPVRAVLLRDYDAKAAVQGKCLV